MSKTAYPKTLNLRAKAATTTKKDSGITVHVESESACYFVSGEKLYHKLAWEQVKR